MKWDKLTSGKFLFTVITAVVFAYSVYAKILSADKITEIILLVVYAYFNKPAIEQNGGQQK